MQFSRITVQDEAEMKEGMVESHEYYRRPTEDSF